MKASHTTSNGDVLRGSAQRILLVAHRSNEEQAIALRSVAADLMKLAAAEETKAIAAGVAEAVDLKALSKE